MSNYFVFPPFCTREEFARLTGLEAKGPTVVLGMCNQATLPTVHVGRHVMVNLHQLMKDLTEGKTEFLSGDYN
ncbi:DNA-binding protein [Pseudomonas tohonis]|uniref:DNA-binding protein n=1 Tax=Pseudomonas tohonis TaxID=2725477 RepID=UPI001F1898A1|nr:DNA-binding protein [Pseudomonas tohonis]